MYYVCGRLDKELNCLETSKTYPQLVFKKIKGKRQFLKIQLKNNVSDLTIIYN